VSSEEADMLYDHVQHLTLKQLFLLWRWIYLEIAGRISKGEMP